MLHSSEEWRERGKQGSSEKREGASGWVGGWAGREAACRRPAAGDVDGLRAAAGDAERWRGTASPLSPLGVDEARSVPHLGACRRQERAPRRAGRSGRGTAWTTWAGAARTHAAPCSAAQRAAQALRCKPSQAGLTSDRVDNERGGQLQHLSRGGAAQSSGEGSRSVGVQAVVGAGPARQPTSRPPSSSSPARLVKVQQLLPLLHHLVRLLRGEREGTKEGQKQAGSEGRRSASRPV